LNHIKIVFGCLVLFVIAGCCKVYCDGRELGISFRKFKARDTDTVIFSRYVPKTGFTKLVDSTPIFSVIAPLDTTRSSLSYSISSSYDWKIWIPSLNRQFLFENFELTNEKCNCGGKYKAIGSYTLDGVQKQGLFLELE
jgi:hypothetical protein